MTPNQPPDPRVPKPTLLVVEDNPDQWFILEQAFARHFPEVEPIWLTNATQAIFHLEVSLQDDRVLPTLILLDLYLPRREAGFNMLGYLKNHYLFKDIPVVLLSQSTDQEDINRAYERQASSYIVKPGSYAAWMDTIISLRAYWWKTAQRPKLLPFT